MKSRIWLVSTTALIAVVVLPLFANLGSLPPHAPTAAFAKKLVVDLIENRNRSRAICQLIELRRYRATPRYEPESCITREVRRFIGSPTGDVFGVTLKVDYLDKVQDSAIAGELVLFDREGFLIPVYHAANLLMAADGVFEYRGAQRWAIAHVIPTKAEENSTTQILSIVPLAAPQRAVLRVILGPPSYDFGTCEGFTWSWRARDLDEDGIPEIEIGPNIDSAGDIEPAAVFRWSAAYGRYLGPPPAPGDLFLRIDDQAGAVQKGDCCGNAASKQFSEQLRSQPSATGRLGVRRPTCDTTFETITVF